MYYNLLADRAIIEVDGVDAAHFLQGLVTNDIEKVTDQCSIYTCMLNPQGKFLYDFFISKKIGGFLLDCLKTELKEIITKLSFYKLRSQVAITDQSDLWEIFHLDLAKPLLAGLNIADSPGSRINLDTWFAFIDPRKQGFGVRAVLPKNKANLYLAENTINLNTENYNLSRIMAIIPEGGKDLIKDKSYPLEYGFDDLNAIDFTKGCYVGQEVTARTKHRGVVRKKIYLVENLAEDVVSGTEIFVADKKIGSLCSHQDGFGLALLRIEEVDGLGEAGSIELRTQSGKLATINLKK